MDRGHWKIVLSAVRRAARAVPRNRRLTFPDGLIVAMFLWGVAHDRPLRWACDRTHYGPVFRPRRLPSVSQFTRRVKTEPVQRILQRVHEQLARPGQITGLSYVDGKPLVVGVASKDPDAARGRVMGGWARGYKLHAFMTEDRRIPVFAVSPLNVHEMPVARQMLPHLPPFSPRMLLLADGNYDAADFHKDVDRHGGRLLCKPRGFARHEVTRRQMGRARRECLAVWSEQPGWAKVVYQQRIHAEGVWSNVTSYGGGLGPLPAFVRRLPRVRRWVGAKIILYHARLAARLTHAA